MARHPNYGYAKWQAYLIEGAILSVLALCLIFGVVALVWQREPETLEDKCRRFCQESSGFFMRAEPPNKCYCDLTPRLD